MARRIPLVHLARTEKVTWCRIPIRRNEDGVLRTASTRQRVTRTAGTMTCGRCRERAFR